MAQLEQFYTQTITVDINEGTFHAIGLPTINAGTALLVTSVYLDFNAAYHTNIVILRASNGATDYNILQTVSGHLTANNGAISNANSSFVLLPGDILKLNFSNGVNGGNVTITVFYRLIPNQSGTNPVTFGVVRGVTTAAPVTTLTFPSVPVNNITFIKSLFVLNTDATDTYTLQFGSALMQDFIIVEDTSSLLISKSDELFRISGQNIVITSGSANTTYYYLSYYYDPLYTA